jgi:hypothetical protein
MNVVAIVPAATKAAIVKSFVDAVATQDQHIQKAVDSMTLHFKGAKTGLTKKVWAALRAPKAAHKVEIIELFDSIPGLEKNTRKFLCGAFWMAFETGKPFKRSSVFAKSKAKAKAAKTKTGKVESTDRAALDETLFKALKQARLLGLTGFASELIDLCAESLDGFEEPADNIAE